MSSSTPLPTILLIHGCFSTPTSWSLLTPYISRANYPIVLATYPSSNPTSDPTTLTSQNDITHIRQTYLVPLIENQHLDIILIVHSYGGVTGGSAAIGLSKSERLTKNLPGGVIGMIYISGNIVHENESIVSSAGGQWPPWLIKDTPSKGVAVIDPLMKTLYNDIEPSKEEEQQLKKEMVPQAYRCLDTPASRPAWKEPGYKGRLGYVRTALDNINPAFAQDLWIENSGVKWDVVRLESSHAPFVSQPEVLAEHIIGFAKKFQALEE